MIYGSGTFASDTSGNCRWQFHRAYALYAQVGLGEFPDSLVRRGPVNGEFIF